MRDGAPKEIAIRAKTVLLRGFRLANRAQRGYRIRQYLASHDERLLSIGSERHATPGWLASDLWPRSFTSIYLDATKPWPIPDGSFDAVLCEHMIEHVPYDGAVAAAREVHRVLRDGGVFRIATPDMRLVKQLLDGELPQYASWANAHVGESWQGANPVFAVNRMMRHWGHTFIYDVDTLTDLLTGVGFQAVTQEQPGRSRFPTLHNQERHGEVIGEDNNLTETMVLEAVKSAGGGPPCL
jgi:predicted SAM-dependent methyltransferase